jgi:hypothetical protein
MIDNVLLIPFMTPVIIGSKTEELSLFNLKPEVAILILGSFVYETANRKGEREFSHFIKEIPRFKAYLTFFLDNEILEKGACRGYYKYYNKWYSSVELTPYFFDSVIASEIICKYYPNLVKYLMNVINTAYKE